jgi:hypothetical protein
MGDGFELPVPRVMQARLKAKIIAGFGCMPAVDNLRLPLVAISSGAKAKSRNQTPIARGTGSLNPSPSSRESANLWFLRAAKL